MNSMFHTLCKKQSTKRKWSNFPWLQRDYKPINMDLKINKQIYLITWNNCTLLKTKFLSWSFWAVIKEYHRLDGLNNKYLFIEVLKPYKSKIKVLAVSMSDKVTSLVDRQPSCCCFLIRQKGQVNAWSMFIKILIPFITWKKPTSKCPHVLKELARFWGRTQTFRFI